MDPRELCGRRLAVRYPIRGILGNAPAMLTWTDTKAKPIINTAIGFFAVWAILLPFII
jgi:hypothetical protein